MTILTKQLLSANASLVSYLHAIRFFVAESLMELLITDNKNIYQ